MLTPAPRNGMHNPRRLTSTAGANGCWASARWLAYFQLSFSSIHGQRPPYSGNCSNMATLSSASARVGLRLGCGPYGS